MSRLSVRLAAVTLLVGLLGGLFGGVVVRQSTRNGIQSEAERLAEGLAARVAGEIDDRIDGFAASLRVLATQSDIAALSAAGSGGAGGGPSCLRRRRAPRAPCCRWTPRRGRGRGPTGRPREVAPAEPVASGQRRVDLVAADPAAVDITIPVESPPGSVVGSLRGRVRLETIVQLLDARLLGSSAKAIFVGPDDVIVDHPERNRVLAVRSTRRSRSAGGGLGRSTATARRVLAAIKRTSALPGAVIIEWDEAEALSVANRSASLVGLLVALDRPRFRGDGAGVHQSTATPLGGVGARAASLGRRRSRRPPGGDRGIRVPPGRP